MQGDSKPYYLVLDFEANCSAEGKRDHEIIEFPLILVERTTGKTIAEYRTFVNMVTHKKLSTFIKDLTHISDEDVANGIPWDRCLHEVEIWCKEKGITSANTTVITCGDWDLKTMLPNQLALTKTKLSPYLKALFGSWTNIKNVYSIRYKTKAVGMDGMLEQLKIELVGHHHSGIDDCRNIAKICHSLTIAGVDVSIPTTRSYPIGPPSN